MQSVASKPRRYTEWVAASRAERTSAGDDNWEFGLEILDFHVLMAWRDDTGFFLLSLFSLFSFREDDRLWRVSWRWELFSHKNFLLLIDLKNNLRGEKEKRHRRGKAKLPLWVFRQRYALLWIILSKIVKRRKIFSKRYASSTARHLVIS